MTDRPAADSNNRQMRRERLFSGERLYDLLVEGDVLLHAEAAARLGRVLRSLAAQKPASKPLRLLDLACGAARVEWRQASAWELDELRGTGPFDLVFIGLNWHHGTPEELAILAQDVRPLLAPEGVLANHDCYRPEGTAYVRRPNSCPRTGEDLRLAGANVGEAAGGDADRGRRERLPAWRQDLIERLEAGYLAHGGDEAGARVLVEHSRQRDYPMSVAEVCTVLERAGFEVEASAYDPDRPLGPFLAFVTARPRPHTGQP